MSGVYYVAVRDTRGIISLVDCEKEESYSKAENVVHT